MFNNDPKWPLFNTTEHYLTLFNVLKGICCIIKTKKSGPRKRLEDGKLCFPRFLGPRRVGESDWVVVGLAVTVLLLFLFSPRCCLGKVHTK